MPTIKTLTAREILDSRGTPTVEVDLWLTDSSFGRAAVPSGASTGKHEAVELRDSDDRYKGKAVAQAVKNCVEIILPAIQNKDFDQAGLDQTLRELDGTPNKGKLGANAILAVSMAFAKAAAVSHKQELWDYFRSLSKTTPSDYWLPVPLMNVLNGGKHANQSIDIQECMIVPVGASSFKEGLRMGAEVFMALKSLLAADGQSTAVGDEGGFAPRLATNQAAFDLLEKAIKKAGFDYGKDIALALDVASSELYENGQYNLASEQKQLSREQLIDQYEQWVNQYPIISIEDPLQEDDWEGYQLMTQRLGQKIQIVGDDLFVTNPARLQQGIDQKAANSILVKLNQIGTVSETIAAIDLAREHNYTAVISHRSGETEDTTIADLAVGLSTGQIKTGSLSRTDRVAKYNQLLRIEEALGNQAQFPGPQAFHALMK